MCAAVGEEARMLGINLASCAKSIPVPNEKRYIRLHLLQRYSLY